LKLRALVCLTPDVDENLAEFADENDIKVVHIQVWCGHSIVGLCEWGMGVGARGLQQEEEEEERGVTWHQHRTVCQWRWMHVPLPNGMSGLAH
jgi:hypothetical protein